MSRGIDISETQLPAIGRQNSALLLDDVSWISRRREAVEILDETQLRRQITVDFRLPPSLPNGLIPEEISGRGHCAPILVLPKKPSNLMSFDLLDSTGRSLPLATRRENAAISAATIVAMAETVLQTKPDPELTKRLVEIAESEALGGEQQVQALMSSEDARFDDGQLNRLASDQRFRWWLYTVSHSSLIMVPAPQLGERSIVKLAYREPILSELPWKTSLGWKPYSVHIHSSFIGGRSFHFEAHSPHGLRIDGSTLVSGPKVVKDQGTLRRTHLYVPDATEGKAATAVLSLRVAGSGFVRHAWAASLLVCIAIAACLHWAENIVTNASSAPALLLVLPGLIATYLGRPDEHGLTQRLLILNRRILMASALVAYATAARVALAGPPPEKPDVPAAADSLQCFLWVALAISALATAILIIARLRSDHFLASAGTRALNRLTSAGRSAQDLLLGRFLIDQDFDRDPEDNFEAIAETATAICGPESTTTKETLAGHPDDWHFAVLKSRVFTSFELDLLLLPSQEATRVQCRGEIRGRGIGWLSVPMRTWLDRRRAEQGLALLGKAINAEWRGG